MRVEAQKTGNHLEKHARLKGQMTIIIKSPVMEIHPDGAD
jgi:hypothetical protein